MKRLSPTSSAHRHHGVRSGYVMLYHTGSETFCPGCGQRQWLVGRTTAECAFCETALPLACNVSGGGARRYAVLEHAA